MKKLILFLFVLIPAIAKAQFYIAPTVEKGWGYASKATGAFSAYNKSNYQNIGLNFNYKFQKNLSVFTGFGIAMNNDAYYNFNDKVLLNIEQNHFEIPLGISFNTNKAQKVNFTGSLGIKLGLLNKNKSYGYDGLNFYGIKIDDEKASFHQTTTLGVLFLIKQRNYLTLELFNNWQIGNSYTQGYGKASINYFGLKLGFAWTPIPRSK